MATLPSTRNVEKPADDHLRSNEDNALLFQTIDLIDRGFGQSGTLDVVFFSPLLDSFMFRNFMLAQQAFQSQSPYGVSGLGVVR